MGGHFDTAKGEPQCMAALAGGATYAEAAEVACVSVRTVRRRMADSTYRAAVSQARGELLSRAVGLLAENAAAAARCLSRLLEEGSPQVQLGTARAILEFGGRLREALDYEERLAAVEATLRGGES